MQRRTDSVRLIYWANLPLAQTEVIKALGSVEGVRLQVVETLPELLAAVPGAFGIVLYDAPSSQAREVIEALRSE